MSLNIEQINDTYLNACNFYSLMRDGGPERRGQSRAFMAAIITVLFVLATADHVRYWAYVRHAFIARGQTVQSIADAINEYPTWFTGMIAFSDANAIIADAVIVGQPLKKYSFIAEFVPLDLAHLGYMGAIVEDNRPFSIVALYRVVAATSFGALQVDYATALYSTSLVTTLFCTSAIVLRIVTLSSSSHGGVGVRSYRGILEILVESSALYFVATLFALIAYIYSGPASEYASAFWSSVTGIAPTLLVACAASTDSRPPNTWTMSKPSILQFQLNPTAGEQSATHLGHISVHTEFHSDARRFSKPRDPESGLGVGEGFPMK
ncbi:hypothetical protein DXG01_000786 [Tephrocybe rancida]|nr:hypothetical protein DXG01_000786 [Tephrocybe rancida]